MNIPIGSCSWSQLLIPSVLGLGFIVTLVPDVKAQQNDPLADEIRSAELDREAALRELEARRAEYLEALRRAEELDRRRSSRPPYVNPYTQYGVNPFALSEAYRAQAYQDATRSYLPRPPAPIVGGVPIAPGVTPYGPLPLTPVAPYGYGYRPLGGIDIPFGFGLGGLSIRW
ncbi:hypothetical protein [Tautonia rosea]|uniref:hypothetical protein n=1 Tax=Tautonia rosea TaxID=2728037 RepID=UPI0014728C49|nr:hypothetical protein [Tautonia rosea]